jgi:hypothetical protein
LHVLFKQHGSFACPHSQIFGVGLVAGVQMSPGMHCPKQQGAPDVPHGTQVVPTHAVPAAHEGLHVGGPASADPSGPPSSGDAASGIPIIVASGMPIAASGTPIVVASGIPGIAASGNPPSGAAIITIAASGGSVTVVPVIAPGGGAAEITWLPIALTVTSIGLAQ